MTVTLEDNYFSETLKWILLIGSAFGSMYLIVMEHYEWIILLLLVISLLSISTKYSMIIDTEKKVIIDSFQVFWISIKSEKFTFSTLNGIRLDKERHVYAANTRATDRQVDFNEYIGTLEYDFGKSIELARKMEYQEIAEEMKAVADQLTLTIERTF